MQAMMTSNAAPLRMQFARRGYMVRSEKRPAPDPQRPSGENSGRHPRRRPPRAGFFYKFLTVLLLLLVWPVGMVLLWRRKLRWSKLMKFFTSVLTLMACILLLGTALTMETHNPRITAAQDSVIRFMDGTLDKVTELSMQLGERAELSIEALDSITEVYRDQLLMKAADAIDWGVEKAQLARERFLGQGDASENPGSAEFIDETGEADAEATPAPKPTGAAEAGTELPAKEAEEEAEAPAAPKRPSATSVPAAELRVNAEDGALPVYIPSEAPDPRDGISLSAGTLRRSGLLLPGEASAAEIEPSPEPEPESLEFAVKPAGEAIVYFNAGTGKYYHTASSCGSMKTATAYRFAETADYDHRACGTCGAPDKSLLDVEYIVWVDAEGTAHLSDECAAFDGKWSLEAATDAIEAGRVGCPECRADAYLAALESGGDVILLPTSTPEPTEEPTEEPTAEPTEEPAEEPTEAPSASPEGDEIASPAELEAQAEEPEDSAEPETSTEPEASSEAEASTEPETSPDAEASTESETSPEASAEPEAEATQGLIIVTPRSTLKPAENPTVYHTAHGKYYHLEERCSGMLGAAPDTVSASAEAGFKPCPVCGAPEPQPEGSETGLMLWLDEQGICHVSDECKSFQGKYTLIDREDALAQGLAGCDRCGGTDYLIPGTAMDPYVVGAPAPEPSPEPTEEAEEETAA